MTAVLNILIPLIAGLFAVAGVVFMTRAIKRRTEMSRVPYNVGRQEMHHSMQIDLIRAVFCFVVALIFVGVFGLSPKGVTSAETIPTATMTPASEEVVPTETAVSSPTTTQPTATNQEPASPTAFSPETAVPEIEPPTATPLVATETPPSPRKATVTSEVGVWLRSAPSTDSEQLEWLLDGTVVTVLSGFETAEELEWQEVQIESGQTGWVAVPFITYSDQ